VVRAQDHADIDEILEQHVRGGGAVDAPHAQSRRRSAEGQGLEPPRLCRRARDDVAIGAAQLLESQPCGRARRRHRQRHALLARGAGRPLRRIAVSLATVITTSPAASSSVSTRRSAGPRGGLLATPVARQFVMVGSAAATRRSRRSACRPWPGAGRRLAARRGQYRGDRSCCAWRRLARPRRRRRDQRAARLRAAAL